MSLLSYCTTERQHQVITLHEEGLGYQKIGDKLGVSKWVARDIIKNIKRRAAMQGHSPDHDMVHTVPDGFAVKGVSTYYNDEGKPVGQWVKSASDKERQFEILCERIEMSLQDIEPYDPQVKPQGTDDNLLSLLTITDFHLGMYAYAAESGEDWDVKIARDVFMNSVSDMIDACPKSEVGVLCQLGDFLHWDGILSASTPMSGHALDADSRYAKLVDLAMSVMSDAVKLMLNKFDRVVVVSAEGNHDVSGSIWLRKYIKHVYANDRVEVIDNDYPYYAYLWGETMLGFHHGHKVKLNNLHKLFASEPRFRAMWGQSTNTYIHAGHYHHERLVEDSGAIAEQHPTLSARDAYAARGGWVSQRGAKVITYHKTEGEIHRTTVRPRI